VKLNDSALSALIWDTMDTDSSVVLLSCVSPCVDHFNDTIKDLRYACKSRKERPTTAARLERVKFRWQNQSAAWAFTLWKGAVADSVQIQLNHEIDNLTQGEARCIHCYIFLTDPFCLFSCACDQMLTDFECGQKWMKSSLRTRS
jgi:hypothetical protein